MLEKGKGALALVATKLIFNLTNGRCLCVGELADRPLPRMRGLIGRRGLPAGEGLLLRPAPSIHTAFMRFSIDALFLDRDLRVLEIVEDLAPWRIASERRARAVLELAAGESARCGVQVGDRLALRDRNVENVIRLRTAHAEDHPEERAAVSTQSRALARLRPLRVLVVSHDGHFRTVMSMLLGRRNCSVTATANASRVAELMTQEDADVVVIDASQLLLAASATAQVGARPAGVVLVADEPGTALEKTQLLAKWGPFEDLVAAIEAAGHAHATEGQNGDRV
ncbi:MAG: hypothetical protein JWN81_2120 [Solirubrobacterales bacterium]|jgi:uncharacterized membrane protein (UPF0127 family)|nr:hypothetical protein [Solirubrobacterales bacterium]